MSERTLSEAGAQRPPTGVQVIARAAEILRTLHDAPDGLTLSQLAHEVELARTTVHRIVQALQAEGLVTAPAGGTLHLGPELGRLASSTTGGLVRTVRPFIEYLAAAIDETVDLAVLIGVNVRFVDQVVPGRRLRAESVVGELYPAHCTANGKALLAALPPAALDSALRHRLERYTENTIVQRKALLAELEQVRSTGVAFDREEHELRVCAVGSVVYDALGARAAITIAVPSNRFYDREQLLAEAVLEAAQSASLALVGSRANGASAPPVSKR
jgi:DNA-binding IclR family transcriptional regulator